MAKVEQFYSGKCAELDQILGRFEERYNTVLYKYRTVQYNTLRL